VSAHTAVVPDQVSQVLLEKFRATVSTEDERTKAPGDNVLAALGAIVVVSIFGTCVYCVVHYLI